MLSDEISALTRNVADKVEAASRGNTADPRPVVRALRRRTADLFLTVRVAVRSEVSEGRYGGWSLDDKRLVFDTTSELRQWATEYSEAVLSTESTFEWLSRRMQQDLDSVSGAAFERELRLRRRAVCRERCDDCHGGGHTTCHSCAGTGRLCCSSCGGSGYVTRSGGVSTSSTSQRCSMCSGGVTGCSCAGARVQCATCAGSGSATRFLDIGFSLEVESKCSCRALPKNLRALVENARPKEILAASQRGLAPRVAANKRSGVVEIQFALKLEWESIILRVAHVEARALVAGRAGQFVLVADFVEELSGECMKLLGDAAAGRGEVAELLERATASRAVRDALRALGDRKPARTLAGVYPVGLSEMAAARITNDARRALAKFSLRRRVLAFVATAFSLGCTYGVLLGLGGYSWMAASLPWTWLADLVVVGLSLAIIFHVTGVLTRPVERRLKEMIGTASQAQSSSPAVPWGLGGLRLALALFAVPILVGVLVLVGVEAVQASG